MGTDYKTRIIVDGEIKVCKYSRYNGYAAEQHIREFFTSHDLQIMRNAVRGMSEVDTEYVKSLSDSIGVSYDPAKDTFETDDERSEFYSTFPEFSFSQSIWDLLYGIYNGNVKRVPYTDFDETYIIYIIDINLDRNEIHVSHGETSYTLRLQMLYSKQYTTFLINSDNGIKTYRCAACKSITISNRFKYCPMCGRKRIRSINTPKYWHIDYKEKKYQDDEPLYE